MKKISSLSNSPRRLTEQPAWRSRAAKFRKPQAVPADQLGHVGRQPLGTLPAPRDLAALVEQAVHETLAYYGFPDIHWQKIRTNNPLERIMREIRRRRKVVGAFPDGQFCLNLAAARLRYIAGSAWSTKRYMNMLPLYQPQEIQTGAVA